jgi:predicted phosphodiesterase
MPITIPPISRRGFLAGSAAAGLSLLVGEASCGADMAADPNRLAFFSDIHINADPTFREKGVACMYDHFVQARGEVLTLDPKPAAMFINGDCAYHKGEVADYQTLVKVLQPLRQGGIPLHLSMGNHDIRENLWKTIADAESHVEPLPDKQVMLLEMPHANFFLLDSLDVNNKTPGVLGEKQIAWLAGALDARKEKPAILFVHHQPDERLKISGLTDSKAFLDVLLPRKQVKALFYGHTHVWENIEREGMHCVNLPAVGYFFKPEQPIGWVDAHVQDNGITLELHSLDPKHPKHGQKLELAWRS